MFEYSEPVTFCRSTFALVNCTYSLLMGRSNLIFHRLYLSSTSLGDSHGYDQAFTHPPEPQPSNYNALSCLSDGHINFIWYLRIYTAIPVPGERILLPYQAQASSGQGLNASRVFSASMSEGFIAKNR